jgi:hypothetical protein
MAIKIIMSWEDVFNSWSHANKVFYSRYYYHVCWCLVQWVQQVYPWQAVKIIPMINLQLHLFSAALQIHNIQWIFSIYTYLPISRFEVQPSTWQWRWNQLFHYRQHCCNHLLNHWHSHHYLTTITSLYNNIVIIFLLLTQTKHRLKFNAHFFA